MFLHVPITVTLVGLSLVGTCHAFVPRAVPRSNYQQIYQSTETDINTNVAQTVDTSRDKVMTFSYDMSLEPKYEKPTYPGTGNGLSGESGEYDCEIRRLLHFRTGKSSAKGGDHGEIWDER